MGDPVMPAETTHPEQPTASDSPLQAFQWRPQPEAERLVRELADEFLSRSAFGRTLRDRMYAEAGVRMVDLVDHIVLADNPGIRSRLANADFAYMSHGDSGRPPRDLEGCFAHPAGLFPAIVLEDN